MDTRPPFNVLSICSGGGGLDLGLRLAVSSARTVCCVEHEAYACEVLATRMEEGWLDQAPIWSDLRTFDGKPWRGVVDCVIGGYPCQPISCAGNMQGEDDPRYLWPHVARIVSEVQPKVVFFENVANHINIGFREVGRQLQAMGFRIEAGLFSASEVGAPHIRKRFFILGVKDGDDIARELADAARSRLRPWGPGEGWEVRDEARREEPERLGGEMDGGLLADSSSQRRQQIARSPHGDEGKDEGRPKDEADKPERCRQDVANPSDGLIQEQGRGQEARAGTGPDGQVLADAERSERRSDHARGSCPVEGPSSGRDKEAGRPVLGGQVLADAQGMRRVTDERHEQDGVLQLVEQAEGEEFVPIFPPGPGQSEVWKSILEAEPSLEPAICSMADELAAPVAECEHASRISQLRLLGNGVVPACAGYAFGVLVHRLVQVQWPEAQEAEGWKAF